MNRPDPFRRKLNLLALAAVGWMAIHVAALAQAAEPAEEAGGGGGGPWLMPYALVVLGIGLGMLFVCRSAKRRARAKPEEYKSAGLIHEETEEAPSGEYQPPGMRAAAQRGTQECKEAKSALIYAVAGLLCCAPLAVFAIIKALRARQMIREDPRLSGEGMATFALIIGIVGVVLWILGIAARLATMAGG